MTLEKYADVFVNSIIYELSGREGSSRLSCPGTERAVVPGENNNLHAYSFRKAG